MRERKEVRKVKRKKGKGRLKEQKGKEEIERKKGKVRLKEKIAGNDKSKFFDLNVKLVSED